MRNLSTAPARGCLSQHDERSGGLVWARDKTRDRKRAWYVPREVNAAAYFAFIVIPDICVAVIVFGEKSTRLGRLRGGTLPGRGLTNTIFIDPQ